MIIDTDKTAFVAVWYVVACLSCSAVVQMSRAGLDKALLDLVDIVSIQAVAS